MKCFRRNGKKKRKKVIASLKIELDAARDRNHKNVNDIASLHEYCAEQDKKIKELIGLCNSYDISKTHDNNNHKTQLRELKHIHQKEILRLSNKIKLLEQKEAYEKRIRDQYSSGSKYNKPSYVLGRFTITSDSPDSKLPRPQEQKKIEEAKEQRAKEQRAKEQEKIDNIIAKEVANTLGSFRKDVKKAKERAKLAEERAKEAEKRAKEAEKRAKLSEERAKEAEKQAKLSEERAEERAEEAEEQAEEAKQRAKIAESIADEHRRLTEDCRTKTEHIIAAVNKLVLDGCVIPLLVEDMYKNIEQLGYLQ